LLPIQQEGSAVHEETDDKGDDDRNLKGIA